MNDAFSVFAHLNVEKTGLYRRILAVFVAARSRLVIALRPAEIVDGLASGVESIHRSDNDGGATPRGPLFTIDLRTHPMAATAGRGNENNRAVRSRGDGLWGAGAGSGDRRGT